jgi:predicted permease
MLTLDPTVVKASLRAVGELLISCGIGAYFTRKGIFDRVAVQSLSKIVYHILLPSLLVVNVAKTVYSTPLTTLLPLPMFATMQIILCTCISRIMLL